MPRSHQLTGIALVSLSGVFFGTLPVFVARLIQSGVQPWLQVVDRLFISVIIFTIVITISTRRLPRPPALRDFFFPALNGFLLAAAFATYIIGIALGTPPPKAVLIAYLYPIIAAVQSRIFLGETLTRRKIAAIGLGVIGVVVTLEIWKIEGFAQLHPGDMLLLVNAFASSSIVVLGRWGRAHKQMEPIALSLWSFCLALIWLAAFALIITALGGGAEVVRQFTFSHDNSGLVIALLGLAILGTAIPYVGLYAGLDRVPSNIAGILLLPEVVSVFVLSAIFLKQDIGSAQIVGGVIILTAGVLSVG